MPSAETIKIVSTTKIIFEANGNARCWIPVEKGQYLAVDSTATAYTSESNHVPYMLYDQANKTLEWNRKKYVLLVTALRHKQNGMTV